MSVTTDMEVTGDNPKGIGIFKLNNNQINYDMLDISDGTVLTVALPTVSIPNIALLIQSPVPQSPSVSDLTNSVPLEGKMIYAMRKISHPSYKRYSELYLK